MSSTVSNVPCLGTVRRNTLKVATANKTVVPEWKCDAELSLQMDDGSVRTEDHA